jgi:hypothetical protein
MNQIVAAPAIRSRSGNMDHRQPEARSNRRLSRLHLTRPGVYAFGGDLNNKSLVHPGDPRANVAKLGGDFKKSSAATSKSSSIF